MTSLQNPIAAPALPRRRGRLQRGSLVSYIGGRIGTGVVTLLVVSILIFLAVNLLPGNVVDVVLGKFATPERRALLTDQLHLNQPLVQQYWTWLTGALRGDLGQSSAQLASGAASAPISELIGAPLRNSLILALVTCVILFPLSILVGTVAGLKERKPTDVVLSSGTLVIGSMPEFVIGGLLIIVFFAKLRLLPPVALVPPGSTPLADPQALALPVLTLLAVCISFCARQIRAGVTEVMRQDYVTTARLNGIRERHVIRRYVLRNSIATSVQSFAQTLQYLLGGLVVVEVLFAYPGIGNLLVTAVNLRDVGEVQAIALILAAFYIAINVIADILVVVLVPKLRTSLR